MKYPPHLIKQWAQQALAARDAGDDRWLVLLMNLSVRVGASPRNCELMIENLAGA